jgi:hypothetical protein
LDREASSRMKSFRIMRVKAMNARAGAAFQRT